jgi:hypothetical protein
MDVMRGIGELFGFGRPKVNRSLEAHQNRERIRARGDEAEAEAEADAARIRSARGGRRAALASQVQDTLG